MRIFLGIHFVIIEENLPGHPMVTNACFFFRAVNDAWTTSVVVWMEKRFLGLKPAIEWKLVSVCPGQQTCIWTPVDLTSSASASEKEMRNAFVAAYSAM